MRRSCLARTCALRLHVSYTLLCSGKEIFPVGTPKSSSIIREPYHMSSYDITLIEVIHSHPPGLEAWTAGRKKACRTARKPVNDRKYSAIESMCFGPIHGMGRLLASGLVGFNLAARGVVHLQLYSASQDVCSGCADVKHLTHGLATLLASFGASQVPA